MTCSTFQHRMEIAPPSRPRTTGVTPGVLAIENDLRRILVLLIEGRKIIIKTLCRPVVTSENVAALEAKNSFKVEN